jgi:nicotinamide-nucleotide amidase
MYSEIINIGEELLIGQVVNTNASWMCQQLNNVAIQVKYISVVSDNEEDITNALETAINRSDIIFITGGLGPTKDDLTKDVLTKFFNTSLELNEIALNDISEFFKKRGKDVTKLNYLQAMVPKGFDIIRNPEGTAPGLIGKFNNKIVYALPGVPFELNYMFENHIIPGLKNENRNEFILHKTLLTQGIGESFLAELIEDWENQLPEEISLAYLPSAGIVRLRLSGRGDDKDRIIKEIDDEVSRLNNIIPEYIFGFDDDSLEEIVINILSEKGKTLGVAESCTGGYISHLLTCIPGSSKCFKGSIVSYCNDVKESQLFVPAALIEKYGAVSEEVAIAMAEGARRALKTDFSLAITGIAGPTGGTKDKPVGLVYIAVSSEGETLCEKHLFGDRRDRNIERSSITALNMLRKQIKKAV